MRDLAPALAAAPEALTAAMRRAAAALDKAVAGLARAGQDAGMHSRTNEAVAWAGYTPLESSPPPPPPQIGNSIPPSPTTTPVEAGAGGTGGVSRDNGWKSPLGEGEHDEVHYRVRSYASNAGASNGGGSATPAARRSDVSRFVRSRSLDRGPPPPLPPPSTPVPHAGGGRGGGARRTPQPLQSLALALSEGQPKVC